MKKVLNNNDGEIRNAHLKSTKDQISKSVKETKLKNKK